VAAVNREAQTGSAVHTVGARIDGDLYAGSITVTGEFLVVGADVRGIFALQYVRLDNPGGVAVRADGLSYWPGLLMSHLPSHGEV
jgi:hypothetical protein